MPPHRSIASKATPPSIGMVTKRIRPLLVSVRSGSHGETASGSAGSAGSGEATVRTTCLSSGATATTTATLVPVTPKHRDAAGPSRLVIPVALAASLTAVSTAAGSHGHGAIELIGDHLTDPAHLASFAVAVRRVPCIVLGPCWSAQTASQTLLQAVLQESSALLDGTGLLQPSTPASAAALRQLRLATAHGEVLSAEEAIRQLLRTIHSAHPAATEDAVDELIPMSGRVK